MLSPNHTSLHKPLKKRLSEFFAIALICAISAIAITKIIGDLTVYGEDNDAKRQQMHTAILQNAPPEGKTWGELGANNLNVRVAVVMVAEFLSAQTEYPVDFIYRTIDLVCLFVGLIFVYYLLTQWFSRPVALMGLLLFCTLLPFTMLDHYFHPWDRPMLLLWSSMIWATTQNRLVAFTLLYALAVVVKLDAILAVGMVWFARVRFDDWIRPTMIAAAIAVLGALVLGALVLLFPGGQEPIDIAAQLKRNFDVSMSRGAAYPPLLVHGSLFLLGLLGWKFAVSALKRLWLFGLVLLIPHLLLTNFVEVRAQVGTVLCMLPLAIYGLLSACGATNLANPANAEASESGRPSSDAPTSRQIAG